VWEWSGRGLRRDLWIILAEMLSISRSASRAAAGKATFLLTHHSCAARLSTPAHLHCAGAGHRFVAEGGRERRLWAANGDATPLYEATSHNRRGLTLRGERPAATTSCSGASTPRFCMGAASGPLAPTSILRAILLARCYSVCPHAT
jgi:hypothetical protein